MRRLGLAVLVLVLAGIGLLVHAGRGGFGRHESIGEIRGPARSTRSVAASEIRTKEAADAIGVRRTTQILFGDFHVHTTFSADAFLISLPVAGGEGAHPPADACDFARHCSALDFWSINDHAEGITKQHWDETIASIRQCNALAGDAANPDSVAFVGWEWSQVGRTPDKHYGHKNVVVAGLGDDEVPTRPIASGGATMQLRRQAVPGLLARAFVSLAGDHPRYDDLVRYLHERAGSEFCDPETHVKELPADCVEYAATPADLYRKLDEWGFDSMVIPHGTTWGFYTPPGSTWDKQLAGDLHDPARQTLLEVYSGHGDSEVYRDWRAVEFDDSAKAGCPEPRPDYLPSCWRAGEIIRERCLAEGADDLECDERAEKTRQLAAEAGVQAHVVVDGESAADWLDSGQCRDCEQPAFNYRPGGAAQYIAALGNFDADPERPRRFRMGFIASSDNHTARPGTGYKEVLRRRFTESVTTGGLPTGRLVRLVTPEPVAKSSEPRHVRPDEPLTGLGLLEVERQASFFMTGGLVAVHANGRDRGSIWESLERREVYGTTGPRILLWFDLLNPPGSRGRSLPMGGEIRLAEAPVFQVRAVGSLKQQPGCPDSSLEALGAERLEQICSGECYHPSDRRRLVTRIEVVRIRPQISPDEDITSLIDDPWQSFACEPDPAGCAVTFSDADFAKQHRDTVYYVRAYEEPAPAINAAGARCDYDGEGGCIRANLCPGSAEDDCLAPHEPRAWSSPIYVDWAAPEEFRQKIFSD